VGKYKLPYTTQCTYSRRLKVRWQPESRGMPQEVRDVIESFGYTECTKEEFSKELK